MARSTELLDYRPADVVKVDILVSSEKVDALSQLVHRESARPRALRYERLAKTIPRQQFKIAIRARSAADHRPHHHNPFRKDVTAKCYGGDITRKRKLLEKRRKARR